jgi:cyclic beta-1,2-glucan synthetase
MGNASVPEISSTVGVAPAPSAPARRSWLVETPVQRATGDRQRATLKDCESKLRRTCERLLGEARQGPLAPKAEWLLGNYAFIQSQIREIRSALPRQYWRHLPRTAGGRLRVYALVRELLESAGPTLDPATLSSFFRRAQETAPLLLGELWAVGGMLRLALVEDLSEQADRGFGGPGRPERPPEAMDLPHTIGRLRSLETLSAKEFVESTSRVEEILRRDPAGVYPRMDFDTRDAYRHRVEAIASRSRLSESEVAALAVELAGENGHVGAWLAGKQARALKDRAGYSAPLPVRLREAIAHHPGALYFGAGLLVTALVAVAAQVLLAPPWWALALLLVPLSQLTVAFVNSLVYFLIPPRRVPRLDFSEGIPEDCRTFVVAPTLLLSPAGVTSLLERLEIHYLANRDPNLFFALLSDFPDSAAPQGERDGLLEVCTKGIRILNERYGSPGNTPFYLFHRDRQWNPAESVWMGHERKRGKLLDFNRLVLGRGDAFSTRIGDPSVLPSIRYVITLDSDTQLRRDAARAMIAALAHPLNRPVVDPLTRTVREGYAILQPKVIVSMESAGRSRLARLFSGQTGYDPYTTAVSDVYQDLHGRASYTGKGIYDVRAFEEVMAGRFPENALLSHDLIEGEFARTGLVTDLELIDDYPATYEAYSKRKHRWVRGDWQLVPWLRRTVPVAGGRRERNPLPLVSRWKIADNLRRSLLEISLFALLISGWLWLPGTPLLWTLAAAALLVLPAYIDLAWALPRLARSPHRRQSLGEIVFRLAERHRDALLELVFLAHQACLMADAIVRTLVRLAVTRRKLLEWETMAQAEEASLRRRSPIERYLYAPPLIALVLAFCVPAARASDAAALFVLTLWMVSPLVARWLNAPPPPPAELSTPDMPFLRDIALRTWRYFADHSTAEHNGLIPDSVQEDPPAVAGRISPTNLGLLLAAQVAARDFGYLTTSELALRLEGAFESMARMERHRGHFYNWYDTGTLVPPAPLSVSTVDSGNLAACLVLVKQACLELRNRPLIEPALLAGLRDHVLRLRHALPPHASTASLERLLAGLARQLEYEPSDLFGWEAVLREALVTIDRLRAPIEGACPEAAEAGYWHEALAARARAALAGLRTLAPWLAEPVAAGLRPHTAGADLGPLFWEFERITSLADFPAQADRAARAIRARLESAQPLRPSLRALLSGVLEELPAAARSAAGLLDTLDRHAATAGALFREMDFEFLFDPSRKLLRIGYDVAADRLEPAHYDLLASEARTAVFLGIAKGDLPREAWFRLGRKLTASQSSRTLLSWTGTMFEYLMPCLFMRTHDHTLLSESIKGAVAIQQRYGRERGLPWGISEAAFNSRDASLSYLYQAFGVPQVALKPGSSDDLVIAPYASLLALMVDAPAATRNLREMAARRWTGRCGFFESVDFCPRRVPAHQGSVVVRVFMAHHQAMGLLSLANVLLGNVMPERFHADPLVQSAEFLLEERVPLLFDAAHREDDLPAGFPVPALKPPVAPVAGEGSFSF